MNINTESLIIKEKSFTQLYYNSEKLNKQVLCSPEINGKIKKSPRRAKQLHLKFTMKVETHFNPESYW